MNKKLIRSKIKLTRLKMNRDNSFLNSLKT
jgi:hypothetical protein